MDTLRRGSSGRLVARWQQFLHERGFDPGRVDGRFGPRTVTATRDFQSARGLVVDGIVGDGTWNEAIAQGFRRDGASAPTPGPKTRKSVRNLTDEELEDLREAMRRIQSFRDNRGFAHIAGFHGAPEFHCVHGGPAFLPWHRAYVYWLEQGLQDANPNVTQPWWDWRSTASQREGLPAAYSDSTTPTGNPNPLRASQIDVLFVDATGQQRRIDRPSRRNPEPPAGLPFPWDVPSPDPIDDLEELLSIPSFLDFTLKLENIHNDLHVWVGGDMASVPTAAFDPLFFAHHCMVDRIWYLWQLRHGEENIPAQLRDEPLRPFNLTTRDVLSVHDLGYDYAGTQVVVGSGR